MIMYRWGAGQTLHQFGALFMVLLTACSSTPQASWQTANDLEAGPGTSRYGLSVISPGDAPVGPVEVEVDDFSEAVTRLARGLRPDARPREAAQRLFATAQD